MFIDYSKAFDSVSHCKLFEVFLEMGFPKNLVTPLKSLYMELKSHYDMKRETHTRI